MLLLGGLMTGFPDARDPARPATAGTTGSGGQVSLTCTAAAGVPLRHRDGVCAALTRLLAARGHPPVVTPPESGPDFGPKFGLHLTLHIPKGSATGLTLRLSWAEPGGPEQGATLNFGVTDTTLDARFYDRFALQILQSVTPPLP